MVEVERYEDIELITETFTQKINIKEGDTVTYKLPTRGYVTRYELLMRLNVSTGTDGGVPREDALFRFIKSLRIEYPGGKIYYGVPDGRLIKFKNILDFGGRIREDPLPTSANVTQDVYVKMILNWGFEPTDSFDPSVVIPAAELSDLYLTITFGTAADLGSGYTINGGDITVTARYISGDKDLIFPEDCNIPISTPVELDINEVKGDLQIRDDLPVGNVLRETLILIVDNNDNRSNYEISEVGLIIPAERKIPYRIEWNTLNTQLRHDYGLEFEIHGLGTIDYEDISGLPLGLDMTEEQVGSWKIGFSSVRSGGKIKMMHIQVS